MTKRIAISELEGAALDWAVARHAGKGKPWIGKTKVFVGGFKAIYQPTKNWSQCGPLIEQHEITVSNCSCVGKWMAANVVWLPDHDDWQYGETALIAACRAIVAAHNPSGYVEVPDELVEGE